MLIESPNSANAISKGLLYPFMILSAIGFLLSLAAHLASLFNVAVPGGHVVWTLHLGIFVVWFPAVLVATRMTRFGDRRDFWKIALIGCPTWMRNVFYVLFGYAIVNFLLFVLRMNGHANPRGDAPPTVVRGFSGHWMIFYWAAFAILYSAIHSPRLLAGYKCPAGHTVSPADSFCRTCGRSLEPEIGQLNT